MNARLLHDRLACLERHLRLTADQVQTLRQCSRPAVGLGLDEVGSTLSALQVYIDELQETLVRPRGHEAGDAATQACLRLLTPDERARVASRTPGCDYGLIG